MSKSNMKSRRKSADTTKLPASLVNISRPRFRRMWMREEAFNSAAKLHKPDRLEHVAERVACILFSNNAGELVQTFLNQDFEPYAMMLDLLGKGEEEFKYRASALREAQRRIVVCAAYADGLDGKRKRAPKLADGHR